MVYNGAARKRNKQQKSMARHVRLEHCIKLSTAYHGLPCTARAALIELIARFNGANNGMITLSERELAYELNCSKSAARNA